MSPFALPRHSSYCPRGAQQANAYHCGRGGWGGDGGQDWPLVMQLQFASFKH